MENLKNIPVTVDVELGTTKKSIKDLLSVSKGTLYRLENSKKDIVNLKIGNQKIGEGRILVRDGKMSVEILSLENE